MKRDHFLTKVRGQVLIIAIIFLAVILILSATMFSKVSSFLRFGSISAQASQATALAEAGVDNTVWLLNKNAGSCPAACTAETALGTVGTFIVTIQNKSANLKTITSTGYIPNSTSPKQKRTVKVDVGINNQIIEFNYAVQVGTGGVNLGQSAQISGSVYSNKTGSSSISCGNSAVITGDAFAVGTISMGNPPCVPSTRKHENQQPSQMPQFNYQQWIDAATNGGTIDCAQTPSQCNLSGFATIGNKKYINGNISLAQGTIATMIGPIYIQNGNLDLGQDSQLNLDSSFVSTSTALVLDGTVSVGQGATINPTSANPKGYIMLATTSIQDPAINIGQSGLNAIFYALNGGVRLGQSAHATAIIANSLTLGQSATLTYDDGLASTDISSGPGGSWQIKKGTYKQTVSP